MIMALAPNRLMIMTLTSNRPTAMTTDSVLSRCLRGMRRLVLDIVSPARCVACHARLVEGEHVFCLHCNASVERTGDNASPYDNPTVRLMWGKLAVERGAAFMSYTPHANVSNAIYAIKYGSRPAVGVEIGELIAREYMPSGFFDGIDLILPMPLHPKRERKRGYNQSRELAEGLSLVTGIAVCGADVLRRIRNTPSQTSVTHSFRLANVAGAFRLFRPEEVAGKHVLVVDDIITTGASMYACASELLKAEGVRFSFLTVGRTEM